MKLLLVVHDAAARGGMEVQLSHLAAGLAAAGHDVRLLSLRTSHDPNGLSGDQRPVPGVRLTHLGAASPRSRITSLRRVASLARGSDLVHCTGWDASLWGRLGAIMARRPVVVTEHTPGREHQVSSSGAPRARWIARHNRVLDRFTAITVICAEWQRELLQREGVAPEKLIRIPNGVPVSALRVRARAGPTRAKLGIPPDATVLVHVARFAPQKRQLLALETTARLRDDLGDVRIVFAGHGPELRRVHQVAERRGADWAVFLGSHDNVPAILALSDLAVLPSSAEAMPMAIIEAIALGVPVVATGVGDVGLLLDQTGAGIHVPADDAELFYRACREVLSDSEVRTRISAAAAAAAAQIDADTMVRRYERLFEAVLLNRGVPQEVSHLRDIVV